MEKGAGGAGRSEGIGGNCGQDVREESIFNNILKSTQKSQYRAIIQCVFNFIILTERKIKFSRYFMNMDKIFFHQLFGAKSVHSQYNRY